MQKLIVILLSLFITHYGYSAEFFKESPKQKAEEKTKSRWTLAEWLEQRDRNRLMDLWLVYHSPSPYEFFVYGDQSSYTVKTDNPVTESNHLVYRGGIGAYASLIGLQIQHENNTRESFNDVNGILHLRLLGNAYQSTNLTLGIGQRTRTLDNVGAALGIRQIFGELALTLYLNKHFGIEALYRNYLPTSNAVLGDITGTRTEGGLFIDFSWVRIYGTWFAEPFISSLNAVTATTTRTGINSGLKFFF